MFSAGQYLSTEKGYEQILRRIWKYYVLKFILHWIFFVKFLSILDHFQVIKKKWFWTTKV